MSLAPHGRVLSLVTVEYQTVEVFHGDIRALKDSAITAITGKAAILDTAVIVHTGQLGYGEGVSTPATQITSHIHDNGLHFQPTTQNCKQSCSITYKLTPDVMIHTNVQ